jgi:hypothetical protein
VLDGALESVLDGVLESTLDATLDGSLDGALVADVGLTTPVLAVYGVPLILNGSPESGYAVPAHEHAAVPAVFVSS